MLLQAAVAHDKSGTGAAVASPGRADRGHTTSRSRPSWSLLSQGRPVLGKRRKTSMPAALEHWASTWHVEEQPSPSAKPPSSHCSRPAKMPSPQTVAHAAPAAVHTKPGRMRKHRSQPPLASTLPSSHASQGWRMPSPHWPPCNDRNSEVQDSKPGNSHGRWAGDHVSMGTVGAPLHISPTWWHSRPMTTCPSVSEPTEAAQKQEAPSGRAEATPAGASATRNAV
mmetsp:Transcript_16610/g.51967  ORF Transcript_16610/g.51967 Transcript_16610/m.51967 type:complete len:225 (-) Transcript_16610:278-952(-)